MLVYRQAGDENREVKIDAGEAGQAERDAEKVESLHAKICGPSGNCHVVLADGDLRICRARIADLYNGGPCSISV